MQRSTKERSWMQLFWQYTARTAYVVRTIGTKDCMGVMFSTTWTCCPKMTETCTAVLSSPGICRWPSMNSNTSKYVENSLKLYLCLCTSSVHCMWSRLDGHIVLLLHLPPDYDSGCSLYKRSSGLVKNTTRVDLRKITWPEF